MAKTANVQEEVGNNIDPGGAQGSESTISPEDARGAEDSGPVERDTEERNSSGAVGEARRYRKRAQAAEKAVEELKNDLAERQRTIAQHEKTIGELERRQLIDDALLAADAIDLEAARILAQSQLAQMDEPDIEKAVGELRRRKPYLFRNKPVRRSGGTLSPKSTGEDSPRASAVEHAADQAITTGKRGDLLRYLRLRRKT
ncbi:MAG: hypothetical protein L0Y44_12780 [Phycisphaerales bacterium]|nr:hypothetical protein [Phycisphaerales bacterium]MCI0674717.1 hypothetical protein [Phycisphaerales bacterium]